MYNHIIAPNVQNSAKRSAFKNTADEDAFYADHTFNLPKLPRFDFLKRWASKTARAIGSLLHLPKLRSHH